MKINKKSLWFQWHEIFETSSYKRLERGESVNLCVYFWQGVMYLVYIGVVLVTELICILCILAFLSGPYTGYWGPEGVAESGIILTCLLLVMMCIMGAVAYHLDKMEVYPKWLKFGESKPNVLVEYLKARKAKFCPMIELEDK